MLHSNLNRISKLLIAAVAVTFTARAEEVAGPICPPSDVQVFPSLATVRLTLDGRTEDVRLTSDVFGQTVLWRMPDQDGIVPLELVSLSLSGNSSFGRVQLRAGRAFGLPATRGTANEPLDPPYSSFFDVFFQLDLPDRPDVPSTRGFANSISFNFYGDHSEVAFETVMHRGFRCNLGTLRCDIPADATCAELFVGGVLRGCCSSP